MIKNKSGSTVMFWCPESEREQPKFVNPGEEIPFKESLLKGIHVVSFRATTTQRNYEIPKVKLGSIGVSYRERFVCDVSSKDGTKTILLRSTYTLHNATSGNIEVKIIPVDKSATEIFISLGNSFFGECDTILVRSFS